MKNAARNKLESKTPPARRSVLRNHGGRSSHLVCDAGGDRTGFPTEGSTIEFPSNFAAAYIRMAAEQPQHLAGNQMNAIREYARRRGLEIIKVYSDNGKSGLQPQGLDSLAEMIRDVQTGSNGFSNILLYDVSRWGRFQDADVSAYYESIFRQAGVAVHYCAEERENHGVAVYIVINRIILP